MPVNKKHPRHIALCKDAVQFSSANVDINIVFVKIVVEPMCLLQSKLRSCMKTAGIIHTFERSQVIYIHL